jgi:hypothetical protein
MFGSFEPEGERVVYGLTKNLTTYNPLLVAINEYRGIASDMAKAVRWRDRLRHLTHGPAWRPQAASAAA